MELPWAWGLLGQDPRRLKLSTIKQMEQVILVLRVTLMLLVSLMSPVGRLGR